MQEPVIETREEVMFFDTDCGGVVHNLAYLRMIEIARTRLAAVMGLSMREMSEKQEYAVVIRTEVDYLRAAQLADVLRIKGWLEKIEGVRFWMAFKVYRESGNELMITCRQQLALVRMPRGKPIRLPGKWFEDYAKWVEKRPLVK